MHTQSRKAFTVIELLVVVSIIALLVGILLPAVSKARDQARLTISQGNLRNLATAHQAYGAEWRDRQLTMIPDNVSAYGSSASGAINGYQMAAGTIPGWFLGWGYQSPPDGDYGHWRYGIGGVGIRHQPLIFTGFFAGSGAYRTAQVENFNQYVGGKFYDKVFFAPKDTVVWDHVTPTFEDPGSFSFLAVNSANTNVVYSNGSYSMSAAAMFSPNVFRHNDSEDDTANGFVDPWSLDGGMRSPSFSQALYPSLKTHMLEHHWLQGRAIDCNTIFAQGSYAGCEPYYYNLSEESAPVTMFYDGHIGVVSTKDATRSDNRISAQTGDDDRGLWSRDTPMGDQGFFGDDRYDINYAAPSFHMLTTNGIRGRDITSNN